jgi:hypothetical protein
MRNVHILPTDKPSRLRYFDSKLQIMSLIPKKSDIVFQNIYITSDEEIKVGYWVIEFQKGDDIGEVHFINSEYVIASDIQKKIILTTDFTLAPDVHKIPDEFLEWFVKNPKCESVEVSTYHVKGDISGKLHYKIIIPQEEPKQIKCYCGHTTYCDCGPLEEPKQETVQKFIEQHGITEQQLIDGYKQGLQLIFENASKITK